MICCVWCHFIICSEVFIKIYIPIYLYLLMVKKVKFNKAEKAEVRKRVASRTKAKFSKFHGEVRKSTLTAIVAAFSFLIALSWKELISEWVGLMTRVSPVQGKVFEVAIITIISVLGILIFTKLLSEKE
jgi:hypothetical protein